MSEITEIEQTIAALEMQRAILGDAVVDTALSSLREKLAALQAQIPGEQRRLVTILFADLVGFTAISEKLDPEDVREILNIYFVHWRRSIENHGGVVEKFIGDAVMAVFGLVTSHENDPENAVRTALEMRGKLEELNFQFKERWQVELAMRVGIHTGQVLVSTLGQRQIRTDRQDFVVVGDNVNLASRLQSAAPDNGILISHDTYRHVRGTFDVQPQEQVFVKGKTQPVRAYTVLAVKPRAFREDTRGVEGIETRLIGRDTELGHLQESLRAVVQGGGLQLVTVVGEAGVGKTRLLVEFDDWVELLPDRIAYLRGRAVPVMQNFPYALLRDLFAFRFQIRENDPPSVVQQKILAGLGRVAEYLRDLATGEPVGESGIADRAAWIALLLGVGQECDETGGKNCDPRQVRDRGLIHLREYLNALSSALPVVLMLEDVHWADDSSMDALETLFNSLPEQRILVVCAARPELYERRTTWDELNGSTSVRIHLQPLSKDQTRQLVREILEKVEDIPETLCDTIAVSAEGNPFFVEEFIKMLIEDGVIVKGEETWRVQVDRLESLRVPQTLAEVLQARLDSLDPDLRGILHRASVIGRVFWQGVVEFLTEDGRQAGIPVEGEMSGPFRELNEREMIFRRVPSAFLGTEEYQFKHALLRDVTYESLLRSLRRRFHARAAEWLESMSRNTGNQAEFAALIAGHFDQAGEAELALRWYQQAVDYAIARFANKEALRLVHSALQLVPPADHRARYELLLKQESIHGVLGERALQEEALLQLETLAAGLGLAEQGEVCIRRASFSEKTGDYAQSIAFGKRAVELGREAQNPYLAARGWLPQGAAYYRQLKFDLAEEHLLQGLRLAQEHGLLELEGNALRMLGVVYGTCGRYPEAWTNLKTALEIQHRLGSRRGASMCLNSLGVLAHQQNDIAAARAYYSQALASNREIGDRYGQSFVLHNLGVLTYQSGDVAEGMKHLRESLEISQEIGNIQGVAAAKYELANLFGYLGDSEAAEQHLEDAYRINLDLHIPGGDLEVIRGRANLRLMQGRLEEAIQECQAGLALAEEIRTTVSYPYLWLAMGQAFLAAGRAEEARTLFENAHANFAEEGLEDYRLMALSGQAAAAQQAGRLAEALQIVDQVLDGLQARPGGRPQLVTTGMDSVLQVYWSCYQVLNEAKDPRAVMVIQQAYTLLEELSGRVFDERLHRSFLDNVTVHRQLAQIFREQASSTTLSPNRAICAGR